MIATTSDPVLRETIASIVRSVDPLDEVEAAHLADTLAWIGSGAPIFRIEKPDRPPRHLVSYFVVVDRARRRLLLVDHRSAGLWLPSGGHVELEEHPACTVRREIIEELGVEAMFLQNDPLFITVTETVGTTAGHIDVSLWYVVEGKMAGMLEIDRTEFAEVRWFPLDRLPLERSDPHMARFVRKLESLLW